MRLRDELKTELGAEVEIRPGWPGQFLVIYEGRVYFSWWKQLRLPRPDEVTARIRQGVEAQTRS